MNERIRNFVGGASTIISVIPLSGGALITPRFFSLNEYDAICNDWYVVGGHLQSAFHDMLLEHGYQEQTARQVFEVIPAYTPH